MLVGFGRRTVLAVKSVVYTTQDFRNSKLLLLIITLRTQQQTLELSINTEVLTTAKSNKNYKASYPRLYSEFGSSRTPVNTVLLQLWLQQSFHSIFVPVQERNNWLFTLEWNDCASVFVFVHTGKSNRSVSQLFLRFFPCFPGFPVTTKPTYALRAKLLSFHFFTSSALRRLFTRERNGTIFWNWTVLFEAFHFSEQSYMEGNDCVPVWYLTIFLIPILIYLHSWQSL